MDAQELKDYLIRKMAEDPKRLRQNIKWQRAYMRDLQLQNHDGLLDHAVKAAKETLDSMTNLMGDEVV